jgi:soluble lytic murein transglycosylase-like protein
MAAICAGFVLACGAAALSFVPRSATRAETSASGWTQPGVDALLAKVARSLNPSLRGKLAEAVISESRRAGYDPLFVLGLVSVESSFRLTASSNRGAYGLMQLKPSTFAWISAREPDIGAEDGAAAEDPVADVRLAIRYVKWLESRFHNRDDALMAYNAGPHRLRDYKREGGIPYSVRAYPRKVWREYRRLSRIAGGRKSGIEVASAR